MHHIPYIYIHTNPSYPSPFVPYPLRAGAALLVVGGQKQLIPTAAATNHAATGSAVMFAFGAAEPGENHADLVISRDLSDLTHEQMLV